MESILGGHLEVIGGHTFEWIQSKRFKCHPKLEWFGMALMSLVFGMALTSVLELTEITILGATLDKLEYLDSMEKMMFGSISLQK